MVFSKPIARFAGRTVVGTVIALVICAVLFGLILRIARRMDRGR
jgi:hypothetical protein